MTIAIGVVITEHIVAGRLEEHKVVGKPVRFPADKNELDALQSIPSGELVDVVASQVTELAGQGGGKVDAIGVAVPGVVRHNIVEESPNLKQLKGAQLGQELSQVLAERGITAPVHIANDADAIAAGVAATRGQLNRLTRVWTIGNGIGYGRWPYVEGVWEGGHITVSLDPKERYCGCGGVGHLEGIMGYRAMRLRFLDKEPEEVFAAAKQGDAKLPRICRPVAPGAGRGDGLVHPPGGSGAVLLHRAQRGICGAAAAAGAHGDDGEDEPAAEFQPGSAGAGRRNRADRRGGERAAGADVVRAVRSSQFTACSL